MTLTGKINAQFRAYVTFSLGFKPVGLNLGGLPVQNGEPLTELSVIKPERTRHYELGIKSEPIKHSAVNLTFFNTTIFDYQALVQSPQLGVNRGYLANAPQVRTRGAELDLNFLLPELARFNGSFNYTDGRYVSFPNAPLPLEETGKTFDGLQVSYKDISGGKLPGISDWACSLGIETFLKGKLFGQEGEFFAGSDVFYRSSFSSSSSPSQYLNIEGYMLVNARLGFRTPKGISLYGWGRNVANTNYFEQLLPAAGNAGHYAGVLGDPRTFGVTLKYNFF